MKKTITQTSEEYQKRIALKEMARICPECKKRGAIAVSLSGICDYYGECKCGCAWEVDID